MITHELDDKPNFSVVMAVHSGVTPEHFYLAGRSVFIQTHPPSELIIVVDGMVSREIEIVISGLELLGDVRVFRLDENVGPGAARHIGIIETRYNIVAIMDSDDINLPARFEKQCSALIDREVSIVGSWICEFSTDTHEKLTLRKVPETHSEIICYAKSRSPMNNVTIMFKKQSYLAAGGYCNMRSFEDYDLFVRMIQSGFVFYNIQEVLVKVRGGSQMFNRRGGLKIIINEWRMLLRFYNTGFYSLWWLFYNLPLRTTMRLLPNYLREMIYKKFLRAGV